MAERHSTSIRLSPEDVAWTERHTGPAQSSGVVGGRTEQIRQDLATLRTLHRVGRRAWESLSEPEQKFLMDLLNGHLFQPEVLSNYPLMLAEDVKEASTLDGLGRKWGVDSEALAEKIKALHPADAWAVMEMVRQGWAGVN